MKVQLCCSKQVEERLNRLLLNEGISVGEDSQVVLLEKGYTLPEGKLGIVFEPLDFMEAFEIIKAKHLVEMQGPSHNEDWEKLNDRVTGYYNDHYALIQPRDILFIEVNKNEVTCVTEHKTYFLKQPLYFYEGELKQKGIIKINKSQLVNIVNVIEIIPWFNSRLVLVLKNSVKLEVSKKYAQMLRKSFDL